MPPAARPPTPRASGSSARKAQASGAGEGSSSPKPTGKIAGNRASGRSSARTRPPSSRSGRGPAPAPKAPAASRPTGWMRLFTVRSAVLILVILMGFILVTPTVLQYMKQRGENDLLREQLAQSRADNEEYENEVARWQDDKYVIAQARERLTFVFPGETPYRVIDPESAATTPPPEEAAPVQDGAVTSGLTEGQTWYSTVWESVEMAGNS